MYWYRGGDLFSWFQPNVGLCHILTVDGAYTSQAKSTSCRSNVSPRSNKTSDSFSEMTGGLDLLRREEFG
jgi:hypothetical protein